MDWGQPLGKSGHGCWGDQSGWTGDSRKVKVVTAVGPVSRNGLGGQRVATTGQADSVGCNYNCLDRHPRTLMILLSLSNSKSPPFVVNGIWNFGLLQYRGATICPKTFRAAQKTTVLKVCSFKTRLVYSLLNSLLPAGCPKYLLSKRSTEKVQNNQWCKIGFQKNQIGPRHSCASLILFTGCLLIETIAQVTVRCYGSMRKNGAPHRPLLDLDV